MARLIREVPKIECVKLESLPSPPRIALLKKMMEQDGRSVSILTGLGALYVVGVLLTHSLNTSLKYTNRYGAFDLMQETQGFMTGFAFPEVLKKMVQDSNRKDYDSMFETYQKWLPMMVYEQQPGLAVRSVRSHWKINARIQIQLQRKLDSRFALEHAYVRRSIDFENFSMSDKYATLGPT